MTKEEKALGDPKNRDSEAQTVNSFLDKDLEAALDSFDNLFCRRCLVTFMHSFPLHVVYAMLFSST